MSLNTTAQLPARSQFGRRLHLSICVLLVCGIASIALVNRLVVADDDPAETGESAEVENSKKRLEFMMAVVGKYQVEVGADQKKAAELNSKPLLRWSNPVSNVIDGLVAAYGRGGRPDVLCQFHMHRSGFMSQEFAKITIEPVTLKRGPKLVWQPNETWIEFKALEGAPAPAKIANLRLPQFRKEAQRFSVVDDFEVEQVPTPNHLRLLAQPLVRYSDVEQGGTIVDGAVFSFVLGTNPEANLFLEIFKDGDTLRWRYAWTPMTIYALEAKLDDQSIWIKPPYKQFCNTEGPYYACQYRLEPSDPDIKPLLK